MSIVEELQDIIKFSLPIAVAIALSFIRRSGKKANAHILNDSHGFLSKSKEAPRLEGYSSWKNARPSRRTDNPMAKSTHNRHATWFAALSASRFRFILAEVPIERDLEELVILNNGFRENWL